MVRLSNFLEDLFGVPPNTEFSGAEVKIPSYSSIDLGLTPNFHLITCDVIEPQNYQGKLLPLLKIIPFTNSSGLQHTNCDPLLYVPVCVSCIENLKIQILDENLNYSDLKPETDTTVVLHIRERI